MAEIKIGIVEDELIIAETIIETLDALGYETTEPCITYTEVLEMLEEEQPDLVLLDIQLAGEKTGIDVAKVLNKKHEIPFIFLTSNSDSKTIEEAKLVNPYAYLVKPFNKQDLFTAIEIALSNFNKVSQVASSNKLDQVIFVKIKGCFQAIKLEDVLFVKSDHVYVEIHTEKEQYIIRSTLDNFAKNLPTSDFFQSHRRYIINLAYLSSINVNSILVGSHEIPISKPNRLELMKIAKVI